MNTDKICKSVRIYVHRRLKPLSFVVAFLFCPAAQASTMLKSDLDRDGKAEHLVLDARHEQTLSIWRGKVRLWQGVPRRWKPWKLVIADVDGDGKREIVLGVHKATRYFPRPHNCLFVFGWDGKRAFPKWLGSSLSKPFTDFAFANLDRDRADELVALETRRDGKKCVVAYSWHSFGFAIDWQRGAWRTASLMKGKPGQIVVRADGQQIILR